MELVCNKCGRKFTPIFRDTILHGGEAILHGKESIRNGSENIMSGNERIIRDFQCPYCGTKYKNGLIKK